MIFSNDLEETVLHWFRSLDNGAGSSIRREDLRHLVIDLQISKAVPRITEPKSEDTKRMRNALETILEIGLRWAENGRKAVEDAKDRVPSDILDSYADANSDLWAVIESARRLLIKGRLRYQPTRKTNLNGFWHRDAEWFGHLAVGILSNRRNEKSGLTSPTSPAIKIVQYALAHVYRETFSEDAIVKAIARQITKDKINGEIVRRRADRLRSIVLPDAEEHPGIREPDDVADD